MKILIKVTKEILERSKMCGVKNHDIASNCAIALAVRDIFPFAAVVTRRILPIFYSTPYMNCDSICLPFEAINFIEKFDRLKSNPSERLKMPELSFEIDIPQSVIEHIGIGQVYKILSESKTLELVTV